MRIKVNGNELEVEANTTILVLLNQLRVENKTMAAAVNMEIVKKENWGDFELNEEDKVEFLQFVGGG